MLYNALFIQIHNYERTNKDLIHPYHYHGPHPIIRPLTVKEKLTRIELID